MMPVATIISRRPVADRPQAYRFPREEAPMKHRRTIRLLTFGLAAVGLGLLRAGQKPDEPKADGRDADREAVRKASQAFAVAFEKGDAAAVAGFFTDEGEYVD